MRQQQRLSPRLLTTGVLAVALSISAGVVAWRAFSSLADVDRDRVYVELVKLSYQFVVIVLLGALLTKFIDDLRDRQVERTQRREQQRAYVRRLIDASHKVDQARVLIRANRSVKTWSEQMNQRIIAAYVDLRDIRHDMETAKISSDPIFFDWEPIRTSIKCMEEVLKDMIDEFGGKKKELSELQLQAEQDRSRQEEVWSSLLKLPHLGDFLIDDRVFGRTEPAYDSFRDNYRIALTHMRIHLAGRTLAEVFHGFPIRVHLRNKQ